MPSLSAPQSCFFRDRMQLPGETDAIWRESCSSPNPQMRGRRERTDYHQPEKCLRLKTFLSFSFEIRATHVMFFSRSRQELGKEIPTAGERATIGLARGETGGLATCCCRRHDAWSGGQEGRGAGEERARSGGTRTMRPAFRAEGDARAARTRDTRSSARVQHLAATCRRRLPVPYHPSSFRRRQPFR